MDDVSNGCDSPAYARSALHMCPANQPPDSPVLASRAVLGYIGLPLVSLGVPRFVPR